MDTTHETKILQPGDILSVKKVLELMPAGITAGWLYAHWEELGGVTIANKKLILRENLYAYLKGEKREVLCHDMGGEGALDPGQGGDESNKLAHDIRGKCSCSGAKKVGRNQVIDHSNDFGLADLVQ
jgi:hypothetical protein